MILHLDNSAFGLLHCKRKFQLTVIEGKKSIPNDIAQMGNALHVMLELWAKGYKVENAIEIVRERYPKVDMAKVISTIYCYINTRKMPEPLVLTDGTPAVEVKFRHQFASVITPQNTKVDVTLDGTIDLIFIDEKTDHLVVRDYKSSVAPTDYLIESNMTDYDLTFQLPFYLHILKTSGTLPAVYKEYIEANRYRTEIHFLYYNTSPPRFKTKFWPAFPTDFIDREVPYIVNAKVREAIDVAGMTTPAVHDGMNVYKACRYCAFKPACISMGTEKELEYLSRFDAELYDPLTFR